jgi:hypothetical protein
MTEDHSRTELRIELAHEQSKTPVLLVLAEGAMAIGIVLLLLLIASAMLGCASTIPATKPYLTDKGARVRVCEPQVSIVPFDGIDADTFLAAAAAVEYINNLNVGPEWIFADLGLDQTLYVQLRPVERLVEGATASYFADRLSGCVVRAVIEVAHKDARLEQMETFMRHEMLHILGIAHNPVQGELMSALSHASSPHPLDISEYEIALLRQTYARRAPTVEPVQEGL